MPRDEMTREEWLEKREQISLHLDTDTTADEIARDLFGSCPAAPFPTFSRDVYGGKVWIEWGPDDPATMARMRWEGAGRGVFVLLSPADLRDLAGAATAAADYLER